MNTTAPQSDLHRAETIISHLLRYGVLVALLTIILGMTLTFLHHPDYLTSKEQLAELIRYEKTSAPATPDAGGFPSTVRGVFASLRYSQGRGVVVLGLLLLICTPVLRVLASVLIFCLQRNRAFILITIMVLVTLLISFILGKVE